MKLKSKHISLEIETTNICPANCVICPREQFTQKLGMMDFDLFKKIIDNASIYNVKSISLVGFGDPLADPELFERCKYIRKKLPKAKIYISTTGFLMTRDKYDNIIRYIDILKLSIFGLKKDTYEKCHRGNLKHETTYSNILDFLEKIKNLKKKPHIAALLVIIDINKHEVNDWIKFWEPKLNEVFVWKPHNYGDGRNYRKINRAKLVSCGRPFINEPYIHVDGKVSMCCFDFNKKLLIGNMKTQTIKQILNSKALKKIQQAHKTKNFKGLLCENCDQINYDPDVLLYATNKKRKIGQITATLEDMKPK
jgi:radical SAM protein with 4Fe4S-binding SPASM domain